MNETQLWYCNICDKAINNKSKQNLLILILINTKNNRVLKIIILLDQTIVR